MSAGREGAGGRGDARGGRGLRILYLLTDPFGVGGVQSDMMALGEDLARSGHRIAVACPPGERVPELVRLGVAHIGLDFRYRSMPAFVRCARALARFLRRWPADVLAPQSVRSSLAAATVGRVAGLPVARRLVTTVHNIHNPANFRVAGRLLNLTSAQVVFESRYERDQLVRRGLNPAKAVVIPSGIDLTWFAPRPKDPGILARYGLGEATPVVGIVARLSEEKGHRHLLRAMRHVHRTIPAAHLLIVGDGPLRTDLEAEAAALGLAGRVHFAGTQRDVRPYVSAFDLFVLASTRESFPLAAREAMAMGKPVVAPRVGGCAEVVDDGRTGLLVPPTEPERLAEALLALLGNPEAVARMGAAGRAKAERELGRERWVAAKVLHREISDQPDQIERFRRDPSHPLARRIRTWAAEAPVALFVGRLVYYKGLDVLLDALPRAPAARLVIVGDGPLRGDLRERSTRLGIDHRLLWLGEIGDEDLIGAYGGADVLVLPSTGRTEAFGVVQVEAMAAGLPVISTRLGTGVERVNLDGVTGRIVAPGDAAELAAALEEIVGDGALRSRLAAAALERSEEFAAAQLLDRYLALYAEASA